MLCLIQSIVSTPHRHSLAAVGSPSLASSENCIISMAAGCEVGMTAEAGLFAEPWASMSTEVGRRRDVRICGVTWSWPRCSILNDEWLYLETS